MSFPPQDRQTERYFLAAPIAEEIKDSIANACQQLRSQWPFQKWVYPADYHITVKFLGYADAAVLASIREYASKLSAGLSPFRLSLDRIGAFGVPTAPRVLWAGLQGEMALLRELNRQVEAAISPLGFPTEQRPYSPHLTLARRYVGKAPFEPLAASKSAEDWLNLSWTVGELGLFQTHLGKKPMYELVQAFPLSGR